jgi:hypothetical protein
LSPSSGSIDSFAGREALPGIQYDIYIYHVPCACACRRLDGWDDVPSRARTRRTVATAHRAPVASHLYYRIILYCMTVCAPSRRGINAAPTSVTWRRAAEQQKPQLKEEPLRVGGRRGRISPPFPRFPCNPLFRSGLIISLLSTGDTHPQAQLANRAIARNLIRGVVVDGVVRCLRSSVNCCRN